MRGGPQAAAGQARDDPEGDQGPELIHRQGEGRHQGQGAVSQGVAEQTGEAEPSTGDRELQRLSPHQDGRGGRHHQRHHRAAPRQASPGPGGQG